jgi:uncharacterized protein (TIGR03083 family)
MNPSTSAELAGRDVLEALHSSHLHLVAALNEVDDEHVSDPSYDDDWTIAQVASHLGSGADIFSLVLDAGLREQPAPGLDQFKPVWEIWNAKTAVQQSRDAVQADAAFVDRLGRLTTDDWERWHLDFLGAEKTLPELLRMRLAEHAVHTWDIDVVLDPAATLPHEATSLIIVDLPRLVERVAKGAREPVAVHVLTSQPDHEFVLAFTTDTARLIPGPPTSAPTATLRLTADAFVRLIYGRLDSDHTAAGSVQADGVTLDTLRAAFPGF